MSSTPAAAKLAEARRTTNLRVLQRLDPQIVDLAITASHVVLYQFSLPQNQWIKKNIEGTLFVCKRSDVPRFKLIVSNRNSTENLEVGITSTFQMQVREPYLIFRDNNTTKTTASGTTGAGEEENEAIHPRGLWFHDDKERQQVHSFLENVVKSLQTIEAMEKEHGPPPSLLTNNNGNKNHDTVSGAKKPPVEVNTNAAGAALLSTLTLNDNTNNNNNNNTSSVAAKSRKSSNTPTPSTPQSNNQNINNALDKKSLQLALLSLIREERFLDLIHAQYLKVVSSRAQREQLDQQQHQHHNQQEEE